MKVVVAFEKKHDIAGNGRVKMDYGVYTQGRIFKIAETEVIMLRLQQRLATMQAAEKRAKGKGRTLYRSWRRVRTIGRKSCSYLGKQDRHDGSLNPIDRHGAAAPYSRAGD